MYKNITNSNFPNNVYVNPNDNHLYHGSIDLENAVDNSNYVVGPIASTLNSVPVFDTLLGKSITHTSVLIDGYGNLSLVGVNGVLKMSKGSITTRTILDTNSYNSLALGYGANGILDNPLCDANTSVGVEALGLLTSGSDNNAFGVRALYNLTTGSLNLALGKAAGNNLITGSDNIYLGSYGVNNDNNTIRIGQNSLHNTLFIEGISNTTLSPTNQKIVTIDSSTNQLGSLTNNYVVGPLVSTLNSIATFDTTTGKSLTHTSVTIDGFGNISLLGNGVIKMSKGGTLYTMIDTNQYGCLALGYNSGLSTSTSANAGNTSIGDQAGQVLTSGIRNTNVGFQSGNSLTTGQWNTSLGYTALKTNISGQQNVALGYSSLTLNTGSYNTAVGSGSLSSATGDNNVSIGYQSGQVLTTGNNNIFISHQGVNADSGAIRLGTTGTQTSCFIAGIKENTLDHATKLNIAIDSVTGQLGLDPECHCTAEVSYEDYTTSYTRTIAVSNTFYEVLNPQTLLSNDDLMWDASVAGRLKYLGSDTAIFHGAFSFCCSLATGSGDLIRVYLAKNGTKVANSEIKRRLTSTADYNMVTFHKVVELSTNDYISCFITNANSTASIAFGNCNMLLMMVH